VSYAATVLARNAEGWSAHDVDLDDADDIDAVVDVIGSVDDSAKIAVLFVEEEDEYLAIVRVDEDGADPRVFLSDGHAVDNFALAALLLDGIDEEPAESDDEDEPAGHDSEPAGDASLLAVLGTSDRTLIGLCNREGVLPSDVVVAVAENAGFLEELEALRTV